eukprot:1159477-Pelagomonas_calceolata.AAC.6
MVPAQGHSGEGQQGQGQQERQEEARRRSAEVAAARMESLMGPRRPAAAVLDLPGSGAPPYVKASILCFESKVDALSDTSFHLHKKGKCSRMAAWQSTISAIWVGRPQQVAAARGLRAQSYEQPRNALKPSEHTLQHLWSYLGGELG